MSTMRKILCTLLVCALVVGGALGAVFAKDPQKAASISALEAVEMLAEDPKTTFVVDVRTRAQFTLLGHPPQAYNIPWRTQTDFFQVQGGPYLGGKAPATGYQLSAQPNPEFVGVAQSLFKSGDRLLVISTDGELGAEAADALVTAGFARVYNIRHGFQGDLATAPEGQDALAERFSPYHGQRGRVNGWVFWGLPVSHQIDPRYIYPPDIKRMQTQK